MFEYWMFSKISWGILKLLSKFGIGWAKEKLKSKVKVKIDSKLNLIFVNNYSFPGAWLSFKVSNYSDVDLSPKNIVAWVKLVGATIDKICWSRQEGTFAKSAEIGYYHNIPDLPAGLDNDFRFYYPLPPYADFGKNELSLIGVIEFDSPFGTVVKKFQPSCNLSEDEWKNALDKWQKDWKGKRTIAMLSNYQPTQVY